MSTKHPTMPAGMDFAIYQEGDCFCLAMTRYGEDAAAMVAVFGDGSTVRDRRGNIVWTEGKEEIAAGDSYDRAAVIMNQRANDLGSGQALSEAKARGAYDSPLAVEAVKAQRRWIIEHGGDLDGYMKHYAGDDERAAAIYAADLAELRRLESLVR